MVHGPYLKFAIRSGKISSVSPNTYSSSADVYRQSWNYWHDVEELHFVLDQFLSKLFRLWTEFCIVGIKNNLWSLELKNDVFHTKLYEAGIKGFWVMLWRIVVLDIAKSCVPKFISFYYLYSWSPRDCATRPIRAVYLPECSRVCDKYIVLFLISKKRIMYFLKYFSTATSSCSEFTAWWKPSLYLQYIFCFLHRYMRPWMELLRWSLLFYK